MFSGSTSSMDISATLSEADSSPEMEMYVPKPEVVITRQWIGLFVKFQRQNHVFGVAEFNGHIGDKVLG